jgi:hypothetical protein
VIVECDHCGAPLEVERGNAFATCSYCGRTNRVKSARTLMLERPRNWRPPETWTPPQHVPAPSDVPLRRRPAPAAPPANPRSSVGCIVAAVAGFTSLVGFLPFAPMLLPHLPFFGVETEEPPTVARIELAQGDPEPIRGSAEGELDASELGTRCRGYVPRHPQATLHTEQAGQARLDVSGSSEDLVMAVRTPEGAWRCDDDSGDGTLPRLTLDLSPGEHRVHVGTYHSGRSVPFTLTVDAELTDAPTVAGGVAPEATPAFATVRVGAAPPSGVWAGHTAGWVDASRLDGSCRGAVPIAPHLRLHAIESQRVRLVTRDNSEDLVMVVRTPSGHYVCDDDSGSGTNPQIELALMPGDTAVWVGVYDEDDEATFSLGLSAPPGGRDRGAGLRPDAAPVLGTVNLDLPEWADTHEGRVRTTLNARRLDPACRGRVGAAPDLNVLTTIDRPVEITTAGDEDLTLIVRGPDGTLRCDDDSGEGRNPRVRRTLRPGLHQIWVGAFGRRPPRFTLRLVERPGS